VKPNDLLLCLVSALSSKDYITGRMYFYPTTLIFQAFKLCQEVVGLCLVQW